MLASQAHAREIRQRLRNPLNAVDDAGIDLHRKVIPIEDVQPVQNCNVTFVLPVNVQIVPRFSLPSTVARMHVLRTELQKLEQEYDKYTNSMGERRPKISDIVAAVSHHYGITTDQLLSDSHAAKMVRPRHVACYLAKQLTLHSLVAIGRHMRGRDHTSILNAVRRITEALKIDAELAATVAMLTDRLRQSV